MSKKLVQWVSLCLVFVLLLCTGCANADVSGDAGQSGSAVVEQGDSVVAVVNGENITREMIGDALLDAEKEVISTYIYEQMLEKFFADIEITDEELELQLQIMKGQVGEDSWDLYLAYYGGGSEEDFREMLRKSLKQEKYIAAISETLEIPEEDLAETYASNPDYYNIAVLDVIFLTTEEYYAQALELYNGGSTLEEISEATGLEIAPNEHTFYTSDSLTWSTALPDAEVGSLLYTTTDSGSWLIARVVEKHEGLEDEKVREQLEDELRYDLAYAQTEKDYAAFLDEQVCSIMGSEYDLYVEPTVDASGNTVG